MVYDRATVAALLDLFEVDSCDFYYNESNEYGTVSFTLFVSGRPERFQGRQVMGDYVTNSGGTERRWTGRFKLNEATVDEIIRQLEARAARQG